MRNSKLGADDETIPGREILIWSNESGQRTGAPDPQHGIETSSPGSLQRKSYFGTQWLKASTFPATGPRAAAAKTTRRARLFAPSAPRTHLRLSDSLARRVGVYRQAVLLASLLFVVGH